MYNHFIIIFKKNGESSRFNQSIFFRFTEKEALETIKEELSKDDCSLMNAYEISSFPKIYQDGKFVFYE